MHSCPQLNILCIGQLMAGKSTFLEGYTMDYPAEQQLKIYLRRERALNCLVYLQEAEQREGVEVYQRHGFDGVLFFVKIQDFHNTSRNVLESLSMLSQASGVNVYKIPIKIVVISSKNAQEYDDIAYGDKRSFKDEVNNIVTEEQVIYLESGRCYQSQLTAFYGQLLSGSAGGIKETIYSNWFIRGIGGLISFEQFKLHLMRLCQQYREIFNTRFKMSPLKWRDRFFYFSA